MGDRMIISVEASNVEALERLVEEASVIASTLRLSGVDRVMASPCPNCGIKGHISVGGLISDAGKNAVAKCSLCDHHFSLTKEAEDGNG